MITEDYVSYEIAKLLKEKGMDKSCFYHYVQKNNKDGTSEMVTSCTLQMAMKWLREVHNIHINLDIHWLDFANSKGWMYVIETILKNGIEFVDCKGDENDKTFYSSYEQACEEALKYCLTNLI